MSPALRYKRVLLINTYRKERSLDRKKLQLANQMKEPMKFK